MITLYRKQNDPKADEIEEAFEELVISFEVKEIGEDEKTRIQDGEMELVERDEIDRWLFQLRQRLNQERSVTADACMIDPSTGEIC